MNNISKVKIHSYLDKREKELLKKLQASKAEIYEAKVALASYSPGEAGIEEQDNLLQSERQEYLKILSQLNKVKATKKQNNLSKLAKNKQVISSKMENIEEQNDAKQIKNYKIDKLKKDYNTQANTVMQNSKPNVVDAIIY